MEGNQDSIKQTLETMNGSLDRIYKLYQKQDERLDEGDKRFQEIQVYMAQKDTTNGFISETNCEMKNDIKENHKDTNSITDRVTKLEISYKNLLNSNQTIINLLKTIGIGLILSFASLFIAILTHLIHLS